MWNLSRRFFGALSDVTIGTAIVMFHLLIAERQRAREHAALATDDASPWQPYLGEGTRPIARSPAQL